MKLSKFSINIDLLKIIALLLMTLDHTAKIFPNIKFAEFFYFLGRFSLPLFAFILMYHLQSKQIYKKYLLRLGVWGGITYLALLPFYYSGIDMSDVPFNVLFMFFACVLALALDDFGNKKIKNIFLRKMFILLSYVFCLALVCRLSIFAFIYIVLIFYYFRKPTFLNVVMTALFAFIANLGGFLGVVAVVATLLAMNIDYKTELKD